MFAWFMQTDPALSAPPTNDLFAGAVEIDPAAVPYADSRDTTEATTDADDVAANAMCGAPATDASVWYSITPTTDTNLLVRTEGTDYSAGVIAVVNGVPGSFELVDCGPSGITVPVEAGVTYHLLVFDDQEDGGGNGGQLELQVDLAAHVCGPPGEEVPVTIVGEGRIRGTNGDDVILGSSRRDVIRGNGGNDIICAEGGNDWVDGGRGDDLIIGDSTSLPPFLPSDGNNDDKLSGGPGNDTLVGLGGDDQINGGTGDDVLIGMGGEDKLVGARGDDTMFGGPGDDELHGALGDDTLFGNFGSDNIKGGAGDDFIDGDSPNPFEPPFPPGGNDDTCNGGSGMNEVLNCEVVK